MTTEPEQTEPEKRNLVAEFVAASGFGLPPEKCRHIEKLQPENEKNIIDQYVKVASFGLTKARN